MNGPKLGYKLFNKRRDGTIGPLFINRRQRIPLEIWIQAEDHPTKGYAHRPGWHVLEAPHAPHLSKKGRVWMRVFVMGYEEFTRPSSQGGQWLLASHMRVIDNLPTLEDG